MVGARAGDRRPARARRRAASCSARSMTQLTYDLVARARPRSGGRATRSSSPGSTTTATSGRGCSAAERRGATVRWAEFDRETGELTVDDDRGGAVRAHAARRRHRRVEPARHPPRPAGDRRRGARGRRAGVRRRRAPHAARAGRRRRRSAPTSSPARRTSSSARTSASSSPTRRCWRRSTRTSCCPSSNAVPERFELGTLPVRAARRHHRDRRLHRRPRVRAPATAGPGSLRRCAQSRSTRSGCSPGCSTGSATIDGVTLYGSPARRTPTVLFSVDGRDADARCTSGSASGGVNAPAGNFYAIEASRWLGLGDTGAVRAGLAPYTRRRRRRPSARGRGRGRRMSVQQGAP